MKRRTKVIAVIFIITFVAAALLRMDDDLHPELQAIADLKPLLDKNNPYFYLMGIDVKKSQSPWDKGLLFYEALKNKSGNIPATFKQINQDQTVSLNKDDVYCRIRDNASCLSEMLTLANDADQLLTKYDWLVTRYKQFLELRDYQTPTPASMEEPIPPYKTLSFANKLLVIEAFANAKAGSPEGSIKNVSKLVALLKFRLQEEDTLIGKMIFLSLLSENIDMLSLLGQQFNVTHFQPIQPLSQSEKSLVTALNREALSAHHTIKKELFKTSPEDDFVTRVRKWFIKFVVKPNMMANAVHPTYKHAAMLSLQPSEQLLDKLKQPIPQPSSSYVRNLVGSILVKVANPDYLHYVMRPFNVDAKIRLLNATFGKAADEIKPDELTNPYGHTKSFFWSENKQGLCIEGPMETRQDLQCLLMKAP